MHAAEHLRIQYDFLSKTVLLEFNGNSHVLDQRYEDKDSAERAATNYAREHWEYVPPAPTRQ